MSGVALPDVVPMALHLLTGGSLPSKMTVNRFGTAHRIIIWLIDGLGYDQLTAALSLNLMPTLAHLLQHGEASSHQMQSVFPSITPVALASLLTGSWPGQHGLIGRYLQDPPNISWVDTLGRKGVAEPWPLLEDTVDKHALRLGVNYEVIIEARLLSGTLTKILHPWPTRIVSYVSPLAIGRLLWDAVSNPTSGLCYVYWPYLDSINHQRGLYSRDWGDEMAALDRILSDVVMHMHRAPGYGPVQLWLVADHGHQPIQDFLPYWMLRESLPDLAPIPFGCDKMAGLQLNNDQAGKIARLVPELFGSRVSMRPMSDLFQAGDFGPAVRREVQGRLGNWVLETEDGFVWSWERATASERVSNHGGRSAAEITVPFVEIGLN